MKWHDAIHWARKQPREEKLKGLADMFSVDIGYLDHGSTLDNNVVPITKINSCFILGSGWINDIK